MANMICFGRRRILSRSKLLILVILICSALVLLLILPEHERHRDRNGLKTIQTLQEDNDTTLFTLPSRSICLPRSYLNTKLVQLHSNRIPNKKYYITIGIPSVERKSGRGYLMKTLRGLLKVEQEENSALRFLIVIFLADYDWNKRQKLADEIYQIYSKFIENGTIDIIQAPADFYPKRAKVKQRFGDSMDRVKWRSKQAVDYSFLLCYCSGLAKYHLQLEDDILPSPHYLLKLKYFIEEYDQVNKTWFTLDSSVLGYIGKVYHNEHVQELATYFYTFFDEMPVDWLEYSWRDLKGQNPRFQFRMASLFEHIGVESSLEHKTQARVERFFDKHSQKFLGLNPPAILFTNLEARSGTKPENAYQKGGSYFWGRCQHTDACFVRIIFKEHVRINKIFFGTGGSFAAHDIIKNGTMIAGTVLQGNDCSHYDDESPIKFVNGEIFKSFPAELKVNCLKIIILKQKEWVLIREIDVWANK